MSEPDDLLSSNQVAELSGITFRVLDYWIRTGVVFPEVEAAGSGSRRGFTPAAAAMIKTLGRVQKALNRSGMGVSTVLLGEVYDAMGRGERHLDLGDGVRLTWGPQP